MAGVAQSMIACSTSTSSGSWRTRALFTKPAGKSAQTRAPLRICAVKAPEDCNDEECAPVKEVGKLSMEWKVEENSKVAGTFPPMARTERKWTGYVEKDTAGQTNIYAVEPTIYVAENAISTGKRDSSQSGSDESLAVAGGLALIVVASAASILLYLSKNAPVPADRTTYSGPPLSFYVAKFSSTSSAPVPPIPESPPLADDLSLAKPEVAIQSVQAVVSDVTDAVEEAVQEVVAKPE